MEETRPLNWFNSNRLLNAVKPRGFYLFLANLLISGIIITATELLTLHYFQQILPFSPLAVEMIHALALVAVLLPLNFYFFIRPLERHIEQHHLLEVELLKSYEILERFFSIDDVLLAYMDADFNFIRVNQAYAQSDQHDPDYYVGKNHFALFPHEENEQIFQRVVNTGKPYIAIEKPFEYEYNQERGVSYWDWRLLPVKDPDGEVIALLMSLTNVTARKRAQEAHAESERRFRAVFDQTLQHIGIFDTNGTCHFLNQTALDFTGLSLEETSGKVFWEQAWWESTPETVETLRNGIARAAAGEVVHMERRVWSASGKMAIMDITVKPLLNEQGKVSQLIYEGHDITRRIEAQEALRRGEAEINRLYQAEKRAHQLAETLRQANQALSGSLNTDTVFETLLDFMGELVPYSSAHVFLLDDEEQLFTRLGRGEASWRTARALTGTHIFTSEHPVFQTILKDGQSFFVNDVRQDPGLAFMSGNQDVLSWMGLPLRAGEQVIGVCTLEHTSPGFFTEDLLHWVEAITGQAAIAIQNAWLFEQVQEGQKRLQALARRLVEAQEDERHHIARELHDEAGQALTSMMVGLRLVERDGGDRQAVAARCQELKEIADGVIEDLHRLAIDLRPASLDHLGLVAALQQYTERISDQHQLAIQFETVGRIERLPAEMETAIYRITQEAMTNAVRHAGASRVDILLERRGPCLIVIVEDNGVGFDPQAPVLNHLGLMGMRERAEMMGGTLTIESAPGQGTSVFLEVAWPSVS